MKVEATGSNEKVVTIYETTRYILPYPPHPIILCILGFLSLLIWETPHFLPKREDKQKMV